MSFSLSPQLSALFQVTVTGSVSGASASEIITVAVPAAPVVPRFLYDIYSYNVSENAADGYNIHTLETNIDTSE